MTKAELIKALQDDPSPDDAEVYIAQWYDDEEDDSIKAKYIHNELLTNDEELYKSIIIIG